MVIINYVLAIAANIFSKLIYMSKMRPTADSNFELNF